MLYKTHTLTRYRLESLDGETGSASDFYFDDLHWTIRHLIANTGNWLSARQVLISPRALRQVIPEDKHIAVNLTKQQIETSPPLADDVPVPPTCEEEYHPYHGWQPYWNGMHAWGTCPCPVQTPPAVREQEPATNEVLRRNPHLQSATATAGYHLQASDGELGHVEDIIIDDETWAVRYLVIDTRNFWPGKKVLVLPKWIKRISWGESKVFIGLPKAAIREAPAYDDKAPITRGYEEELHRYYRQDGYWVGEASGLAKAT